jgi:DNA-binding NtrC family response regulator
LSQNKPQRVLIADDDHNILAALKLLLSCADYEITLASHPEQVVKLFSQQSFDCILLDLNFNLDTTSGEEGLALIEQLNKIDDIVPIIVMTGWATVELAVNAMQKGAVDFIQKPWENERVLSIVETQIRLAKQCHQAMKLNQENKLLKSDNGHFEPLIAESESMKQVLAMANQVALSDINILITGDNGTGKSLLAEHIHAKSNRNDHSLINVNMGAISENLFESEMFGHVKGAFTDARENRIGRFELADQGSLFLDEIGNIPLSQQAKLLRVLESQQFEKVGASKTQQVDTRVIAATNADIEALIKAGEFRQDLLYRLNTIVLKLPSLRERIDDIIPMANHFLAVFSDKYQKQNLFFSESAITALLAYQWPGNIRELNHMIERAVVLSVDEEICLAQLALTPLENNSQNRQQNVDDYSNDLERTLDEIDSEVIQRRLQRHSGNMVDVAKSLGLSRSAFYRRIDKYNL